jgi:hypothetical protein
MKAYQLGFILALCALVHAGEPPQTIAIIPGEGECALSEAAVAKIEVALSEFKGVTLIERAEIRKIIAEQKLGATALSDPATSVRLGQILPANIFVVVERIPKITPPLCRLQIIEGKTGIILAGQLQGADELLADARPAANAVVAALEKIRMPEGERRFVCVLGVRNEEPGHFLDGLAEALPMFLATDLNTSPSVILLTREHLEKLTAEKDLTGTELKLKTSAYLLSAGIRRVEEKTLACTLELKQLASALSQTVTVNAPSGDIRALREALVQAARIQLQADAPKQIGLDAAEEADIFSKQARLLSKYNETLTAIQAAEAALALCPSPEYRLQTLWCWRALSDSCHGHAIRGAKPADAAVLAAARRTCDLAQAIIEEHIAAWKSGKITGVKIPVSINDFLGFARVSADTEEKKEVLRRGLSLYRAEWEYYAARWQDDDPDNPRLRRKIAPELWCEELGWSPGYLAQLVDDVQEYTALMRDAIQRFESPPESLALDHIRRNLFCCQLAQGATSKFKAPSERRTLQELYEWGTTRQDRSLRVACYLAIANNSEANQRAAATKKALDLFVAEIPLNSPERQHDNEYLFSSYLAQALQALVNEDVQAADIYCPAILTPILEAHDSGRLNQWSDTARLWLNKLEKTDHCGDAYRWAQKFYELLCDGPKPSLNGRSFQYELAKRIAVLEERGKGQASAAEVWQDYGFVPLQIGSPPEGGKELLACESVKDDLVLVWRELSSGGLLLKVSKVPACGGAQVVLGEVQVKARGGYQLYKNILWILPDNQTVYIGIRAGGVAIVREGIGTLWTEENGLPGNHVFAAARYKNKLYFAFGDFSSDAGALAEYDETSNNFTILASSRSQQKRNVLDGGLPYAIWGILPDTQRKCLWLAIESFDGHGPDTKRNGLWKYTPETGEFEQIGKRRLEKAVWSQNGILAESSDLWVGEYDLDAGKCSILLSDYSEREHKPVFGKPQTKHVWPCVRMGGRLLVGGDCLSLYVVGEKHPYELWVAPDGRKLADVRFIRQSGAGVIVGTASGDFWRLEPRSPTEKKP